MKILLAAVNAKYIHSNLAIYSLRAYAAKYRDHVELAEFTINNYEDDILQEIYKRKPDIAAFSCYIWNISMILGVAEELHKVLPHTKIWLGGPEVSYDAKKCLESNEFIDGIMMGEGEGTFFELAEYFVEKKGALKDILGIAYREQGEIQVTAQRPQLSLDELPFPYENIEEFKNKIIYYETSRGCPYSCSYCLSSIDKRVRFRNMELVKRELSVFLEHRIPQVKFVDRTFNCNREHARNIWRFIKEHDNGITNFHFEISADILGEEELELLSSLREGLVQLEIGVQSTNLQTIEAIQRKMDFKRLSYVVQKIDSGKNIHQHLDLIAGLPYEDYKSFRTSFNSVYALYPEQLQLGFLKVLKGSYMHEKSSDYGTIYKESPPYEVLFTRWLSYEDVLKLKSVEEMVEVYYNSGQFGNTVAFLINSFETPFDFYESLGVFYEKQGLNKISHSRIGRYDILLDFFRKLRGKEMTLKEEILIKELLVYDLYLREKLKSRPDFAEDFGPYKKQYQEFYMDSERTAAYLPDYGEYSYKQLSRLTHIEHFTMDLAAAVQKGEVSLKESFILFDYQNRSHLNHEARTVSFNL